MLKYAILMFRFFTALLYKLHHLMYRLVRQKYVTPHLKFLKELASFLKTLRIQ